MGLLKDRTDRYRKLSSTIAIVALKSAGPMLLAVKAMGIANRLAMGSIVPNYFLCRDPCAAQLLHPIREERRA
jgi:hypothetical protein